MITNINNARIEHDIALGKIITHSSGKPLKPEIGRPEKEVSLWTGTSYLYGNKSTVLNVEDDKEVISVSMAPSKYSSTGAVYKLTIRKGEGTSTFQGEVAKNGRGLIFTPEIAVYRKNDETRIFRL